MGFSAESERRRPRGARSTLEEIFEVFASAPDGHMTDQPASEEELRRLEGAISRPLPPSLRAFLSRFGGGLFFHGHEIFGPRRVMVHDIELVPDLLSIRRWLAAQHTGVDLEGLLPFHRARGLFHLIDVRPGVVGEPVVSLPPSAPYADLASFLETVVLPRRTAPTEP